ncbi:MAG: hypothetical protein CVU63_23560, partial [Deltaproteobacteria bacterium HGW-Deltaproteobacteria-20]
MSTPKNWIIALLLLVIAGQAWLLWNRESGDGPKPLSVVGVSLDSAMRTTLAVEFDQPVPDTIRAQAAPAGIEPSAEGQWVWTNPYTLKFLAQTPLPLDMQYSLTLSPAVFPDELLRAERTRLIRTGSFAVQEMTVNELASEAGPEMVELEGRVVFNAPVDPASLLAAMSLSEAGGDPVELSLLTQWRTTSFGFRSAPVRKDTAGRILTLRLAPELTVAEKSLSLGQEFRRDIELRLDPVLRIVDVSPQ